MDLKTWLKKRSSIALSLYPGQLFPALDKPIDFALKRVSHTISMLNNPLYSNAIFSKLLF